MHRSRLKYVIEVIIHVLFWAGVYYTLKALTTATYSMVRRIGDREAQTVATTFLFPYTWIVLGSLMVLFYSNTFWLFKKVIRYSGAVLRVAVIAGWSMLLFVLNYLVVRWCIGPAGNVAIDPHLFSRFDPSRPPPPFAPASPLNNWQHMQLEIGLVFLSVLAVAIAQFFIKEWIRNDLRRSQAEAHQLSTEIKFLRSQVNPHFLFNTLNNLFSMAQKRGNDELADGISKLSGMMRYMIYESNPDQVCLFKEIDYLKSCIALNKLRYADSEVAVTFGHPSPAEIADVQVAPMLFIPFVENAFKHGVAIGRRSCIAMTIAVAHNKLSFTCENTDHSDVIKPADDNTGIGLANVRRRLELVYGGKYALRTGSEGGKYRVHLQIDLA